MRRIVQPLLASALALSLASGAAAEPTRDGPMAAPVDARPRLGLVLSGGGARGAAHIGVLQVLEELRVPVDIVAGTSMGAVTGGLYAAGLSPVEMSDTLQQIDWVNAFEDKPGRQDLSFRRKQDDRTFLTDARLAFKDWRIFIPSGLVEGQKLDFLLRALTLDRNGTALIEDLPLEFRAVATDIETGAAVVFDQGELAIAQRASMSIPGAFSPVRLGDRLLVDGFVSNNLPIDVAQAAGAQAIIAVDVGTPTSEVEQLASAVAISAQVSALPIQAEQRRQIERLGPDDVLIRPPLGGLSSSSFTEMAEAIEIGRQAALAAAESLSRYSVSPEAYAAWRARQRRPPVVMPVVDRIEIENGSLISDRTIRASLRVRVGEPLDVQRLGEDLGRLFGLDAFERVQFDLRPRGDEMVLYYHLDPRERGTNSFRLGLNLETIFGDESNFTIAVNHVWYPANAWGGELRSQAQFGKTSGVSTGFYQPIDPREWFFVLPQVEFQATDQDIYVSNRRVARYDVEAVTPQLLLGVNLSNLAQLRGGLAYTNGGATRSIGDPTVFQSVNFSGGAWVAAFELDRLDDARFPTDGESLLVESFIVRRELGFEEDAEELRIEGQAYRTFAGYTIGLTGRYDTSFNAASRVDLLNSLGGFLNLSGFPRDSIVGRHVGLLGIRAYKSIATPSIFAWKFPVYLGGIFETGNAWNDREDYDNLLWSASPFVGADTPLGPLYVAYAYGEGGEHQGYLYLGVPF